MVQKIYKELMLMGIVSFTIVMVEANKAATNHTEWILGIDFSHIVLFYIAIFFVFHAFYIMWISYSSSKVYIHHHCTPLENVVQRIFTMSDWRDKIGYNFDFVQISPVRDIVEFKILASLFEDTYWFPENFDFATYINFSFEKYALKTIDRGIFSYFVLICLVLLNFARVKLNWGLNCGNVNSMSRIHHEANITTVAHSIALQLNETIDQYRILSSESVSQPSDIPETCYLKHVKLFFVCGTVLILYSLVVLHLSRSNVLRLV